MTDVAHGTAVFLAWAASFLGALLILAYRRAGLALSSWVLGILLLAYLALGSAPAWWKILLSIPYASLLLLNIRPLRLRAVTRPFLRSYRRLLPPMSATEREALDAGTVWWDGELFTGGPDWQKLMSAKAPALTAEEQAFLDGPCEELCAMLDDWDITHVRADLPPEVWKFIKAKGFFGVCAFLRADQDRLALGARVLDHCGAELAGAGGTAVALRHPSAERSLPAAPRARRGSTLLRPHRSSRGLGCRLHSRHRRHLQRPVAGLGNHRHQAEFLEALHHPGARRHRGRARLSLVRSRQAHG